MLYGGQAIIKGVMMRSPRFFAVSCRRENGDITTRVERVPIIKRPSFLRWPLFRGAMALVDAMNLGIRALLWSAGIAMEDTPPSTPKQQKEAEKMRKCASGAITDVAIGSSMVFGLGFGVFLFVILPNVIAGWLEGHLTHKVFVLNAAEGIIKIVFFLAYVSLIGLMRNIREVFEYHGGEHRAINTFEAGESLTLDGTRQFGTLHVRCGSNFILIVLVLSIFVFAVLPWCSVLERVAMRLVLLPLVGGIAYEIIRFAGRHSGSGLVQAMLAPGLALQRITTRSPSDDQVEVALASLRAVIDAEESGSQVSTNSAELPASA